MITINDKALNKGLGTPLYQKLIRSRKQETIEIIFTKGKLEIILDEVERINVYPYCMYIIYKNQQITYINLYQVTQIN